MKKNVKGITLVSMVITIIVMLILAGVSISMVVGENGVLTRASSASDKTKLSEIAEDFNLAVSDVEMQFQTAKAYNSSVESKRGKYVTVERLNESLGQTQILCSNAEITSGNSNEGGRTVSAIYGGGTKDVGENADGTKVTSEQHPISYLANTNYTKEYKGSDEAIAIYLSDSDAANELGANIYVAICQLEGGVPKLINVGVILSDITTDNCTSGKVTLDGEIASNSTGNGTGLGKLPTGDGEIVWLY